MRSYDSATTTYLANRKGYLAHGLVWITARNRSTGATETIGLSTLEEDRNFAINGVTRAYIGAGGLLDIAPILMETGLVVRLQRVMLNALNEAVRTALLGYDTAFAPVEIHRASYDTTTMALVSEPVLIWKGQLDRAPIPTPEIDGEGVIDASLSSAARRLTRALSLSKSDEVQRLRADDRFDRYRAVSGRVTVAWGEARATGPASGPATKPTPPSQRPDGGR